MVLFYKGAPSLLYNWIQEGIAQLKGFNPFGLLAIGFSAVVAPMLLTLPAWYLFFWFDYLARKKLITEADYKANYEVYLEYLRSIAKDELEPEARQKQQELIAKEDKKIQTQRARDQKDKEALAAKRKHEEQERQEQEEFESKLSDLHSDIMKSM